MHILIEDRIRVLMESVEQAKICNDDLELVLTILPKARIYIDYEVNVSWPTKSFKEVNEVIKQLIETGNVTLKESMLNSVSPTWILQGINTTIRICPIWGRDEDNDCRLVKVGVIKSEVPKYRLVCDEEYEAMKEEV